MCFFICLFDSWKIMCRPPPAIAVIAAYVCCICPCPPAARSVMQMQGKPGSPTADSASNADPQSREYMQPGPTRRDPTADNVKRKLSRDKGIRTRGHWLGCGRREQLSCSPHCSRAGRTYVHVCICTCMSESDQNLKGFKSRIGTMYILNKEETKKYTIRSEPQVFQKAE